MPGLAHDDTHAKAIRPATTGWRRSSWHATRICGQSGMNDGTALRLEVVPPLSRSTAWIDVIADGLSARARATIPLRWE